MAYTQVSSKFQIVIPKEVRERLHIKPKQRLLIREKGGVIYLIPDIPIKQLRGIFKDLSFDLEDLRDKEDRL